MNRAQKRDAVHQQKFYFRRDVFPAGRSNDFPCTEPTPTPSGDKFEDPCAEANTTSRPALCKEAQATTLPSSCGEAKVNGISSPPARPFGKENALRNCYPDVEPPVTLERRPIEEEYEEMTINEVINGKVCFASEV
jgi:glutamate--cysteine ligase catalytic subunit